MKTIVKWLPVLALLIFSLPALAHEGHGVHEGHSLTHYMLSWEHAIGILVAVVFAIVGVKWYQARRQRY